MAQPSNRSGLVEAAVGRWNSTHPRSQQIDLQAELRVAGVEGLSGGVGDGGHAFGPNQANDAGGTLTGKLPRGWTPAQKNAWAWSPEGLDFQLSGVAAAAGGQHGRRAIENIIRLYERPADPNGEVARALGGSMQSVPAGASSSSATVGGPTAATGAPDSRRLFAQQLLAAISPTGQLDNRGLVGALQTRQQSLPVPASFAPAAAPPGAAPTRGGKGILELLKEGVGGPTHSTGPHIHAAFGDPRLEIAAINWAQQHGLHVGENPYVGDTVDPVHAPNSYHTRDFPGKYNGRKLGMAIDVSGGNTDAFYNWLAGRR